MDAQPAALPAASPWVDEQFAQAAAVKRLDVRR
jgi:hypothetical protein